MTEHILDDRHYTALKIYPSRNILFLGTNRGEIIYYNIDAKAEETTIQYVELDDYGDLQYVQAPVMVIDNDASWSYLYAFFDYAAYCIDIELGEIISRIEIEEKVISGALSKQSGRIAILSVDGYLSNWSAKFESRIGYFTIEKPERDVYIFFNDDDELILVKEGGEVMRANFEENYSQIISAPEHASYLASSSYIDSNPEYIATLNSDHTVHIIPRTSDIHSKLSSYASINITHGRDEIIGEKLEVLDSQLDTVQKSYIEDKRITRESRDRYFATVDAISSKESTAVITAKLHDSNVNLTLHHALLMYYHEGEKVKSMLVIKYLAQLHKVAPVFIRSAWFYTNKSPTNLIETAKIYQLLSAKRNLHIKVILGVALVVAFISVILQQFFFNVSFVFPLTIALALFDIGCVMILNRMNRNPVVPKVNAYMSLQFFIVFVAVLISIIGVVNLLIK